MKAATLHARSLARALPGVPANVEALVGRALAFEKKERWASATEMRRELWRVRLDPGRPIGTTSAPPPRNPSSAYPTIQAKRDSDKPSIRELGMAMTGEHRIEPTSRRAVFFSTLIAVLLVASALTFGIYMTIGQKELARPVAAAPAPPDKGASGFLPTGLTDGAGSEPLAITETTAKHAATGQPTTTTAAPAIAAGTTATPSATTKPAAPVTAAKPAATVAKKGAPAAASTHGTGGDIYKPF